MLRKLVGGFAALLLLCGAPVASAQVLPYGQVVFQYNSFKNITTSTTTVVKTVTANTTGIFAGFCVNTVGTTSTLQLYDNTVASGTLIGTWTTTAVGCYTINVSLKTGLTAVTTGSPAADLTVFYR